MASVILPPMGILAELSAEERADLGARGELFRYQKGDVVLEQGEPQGFLRYVVEGELGISTSSETAVAPLGYAHPGDCVGEMSLLDRVESVARVVATAPSTIWCLARDAFDAFCQQRPVAAVQLLKGIVRLMSRRLRTDDARLVQAEEGQT
ncbi:MAG: Crp/Fnr family transcriptional regulator [Verrucomicrobiales bacterium]